MPCPRTLQMKCKKTRLCKYWMQGRCQHLNCTHAHGLQELRPIPDLKKTRLCPLYSTKAGCELGAKCPFAHTESEVRSTNSTRLLTRNEFRDPILPIPEAAQEETCVLNEHYDWQPNFGSPSFPEFGAPVYNPEMYTIPQESPKAKLCSGDVQVAFRRSSTGSDFNDIFEEFQNGISAAAEPEFELFISNSQALYEE